MAIIDVRVQVGTTPMWGTPFMEPQLARVMERYGIEKCIVSSTYANSSDFIKGNAQTATIAGKDGIFGCAVVNTQYPQQSIEDMRKYLTSTSFVALKVHAGAPGRTVTLQECADILNAHRRFGKPILLPALDREAVIAANDIAKAFPGIKFVLLSMGGDAWRTAVALAEKTLNLILEVSGNMSPDKISECAEVVGPQRMVFGSNLPFADPVVTIGLVGDANISDGAKKLIFESNARRLFGWAE